MLGTLWAGNRGIVVRSSTGKFISYPERPDRVPWAPSGGITGMELEADHLPPSSAVVKNEWIVASFNHTSTLRPA